MKKTILAGSAVMLFAFPVLGELTGLEIAEKVKYANQATSSVSLAVVKLYSAANGGSPAETRKTVMLSRRFGGRDDRKTVIRFTDRRSSYKGTTFLSIENGGRDTVYYIRLASLGRERRLSSSEKQNNFVDTDFTNETLGGIKLGEYRFQRIADLEKGGKKYYRVWGHKKDAAAKFPKYMAIVNPDTFVAERILIYDRNGRVAREVVSGDVRQVQGKNRSYHIPFSIVIRDRIANHRTEIALTRMTLDTAISASRFQPENMGRVWTEEQQHQ